MMEVRVSIWRKNDHYTDDTPPIVSYLMNFDNPEHRRVFEENVRKAFELGQVVELIPE